MRYFRRAWPESRGDEYAEWGDSTWFFETDESLVPLRQIEEYANGNRLLYDSAHREDDYGFLGEGRPFPDDEDEAEHEIAAEAFEEAWTRGRCVE